MRVRSIEVLLAASLSLLPGLAVAAVTSPHDKAGTETACYYCHSIATPSGTGNLNFSNACLSCHNTTGGPFVSKWMASNEAIPGVQGNSHAWSKPAVSPQYGADTANLPAPIPSKLVDGNLQCAVCHDAHRNVVALRPESMHVSIAPGTTRSKTGTVNAITTGSAMLGVTVPTGSGALGYRVRITEVTAGGGKFILSHDYGWNPDSWLNYSAGVWAPGVVAGPGRDYTNGVDVPVDIAGVTIKISAGALVGDYWDFYVNYPMLRLSNVSDLICSACHRQREMNHVRARGTDAAYLPNGIRKFSHPVGVALNANGFGTDRTRVLDADGTPVTDIEGKVGTSVTDADDGLTNATNDLVLDGGIVRCTTCHRVHNADSNSLSRDAR